MRESWGQGERRTADVDSLRKDREGSPGSPERFLTYYVSFQVSTYSVIKTISFYYTSSPITWWQIDGETVETVAGFILRGSKITAKSLQMVIAAIKLKDPYSDITFSTKVRLVKAVVFPLVMYGCESWTVKKAEHQRLMLLNCGVGEDSWESLGLQGGPTSPS